MIERLAVLGQGYSAHKHQVLQPTPRGDMTFNSSCRIQDNARMLCVLGAAATGLGLEICQQGFAGFLWFRAVRTT